MIYRYGLVLCMLLCTLISCQREHRAKGNQTPSNKVYAAFFSPDSKTIAVGCGDGSIYFIGTEDFHIKCSLKTGNSPVVSTLFSSNGRQVIAPMVDSSFSIINAELCKPVLKFRSDLQNVYHAAAAPHAGYIGFCGSGNQVQIVDTNAKPISSLVHPAACHYFWFLQTDSLLVSACTNGVAYVWNYLTADTVYTLRAHSGELYCISATYNDQLLISTSADSTVCLWHWGKSVPLSKMRLHTAKPVVGMIRPNQTEYAVCFDDGEVVINQFGEKSKTTKFKAHKGEMVSLHYNSNGNYLVTAGMDGYVRLWDCRGYKLIRETAIKIQ